MPAPQGVVGAAVRTEGASPVSWFVATTGPHSGPYALLCVPAALGRLAIAQPLGGGGENVVHHVEVFLGFIERHYERWTDAEDLAGQRAEQVDRPAGRVAEVARFHTGVGHVGG